MKNYDSVVNQEDVPTKKYVDDVTAAHVAAADPHPQYLTQPEGDARYQAAGSGVTDHGALTGLTDDDHTQYHTDARGDARYARTSHTHAAADITSGILAIARIPTGTTSTTVALGNHTHPGLVGTRVYSLGSKTAQSLSDGVFVTPSWGNTSAGIPALEGWDVQGMLTTGMLTPADGMYNVRVFVSINWPSTQPTRPIVLTLEALLDGTMPTYANGAKTITPENHNNTVDAEGSWNIFAATGSKISGRVRLQYASSTATIKLLVNGPF